MLQLNFTEKAYLQLREGAIESGADIYPPYNKVQEMKKASLPKDIIYKDDEVVVTLQATVNNQIDNSVQKWLKKLPGLKKHIQELGLFFPISLEEVIINI